MAFSADPIVGSGVNTLSEAQKDNYLTKPECLLHIREAIYLDTMLDLF